VLAFKQVIKQTRAQITQYIQGFKKSKNKFKEKVPNIVQVILSSHVNMWLYHKH